MNLYNPRFKDVDKTNLNEIFEYVNFVTVWNIYEYLTGYLSLICFALRSFRFSLWRE